MNWAGSGTIPEGKLVKLLPMNSIHIPQLVAAGSDKRIFEFFPDDFSDAAKSKTEWESALLKKATGEQYPLVITDKAQNKVIGSTRLYNAFPEHKKLEIGWTWYNPEYWGKGHNIDCKLLLLTYCFEILGTVRVQFQIHEKNVRSRKAVEKIGGKFEGILRNDRIQANGNHRNTAVYSIIKDEWQDVKQNLESKLQQYL